MKALSLILIGLSAYAADSTAPSWSKPAANYLDSRFAWWSTWPQSQRDHDSFCISCHTTLPYAIARPALRSALGESGPTDNEKLLLDNVTKRVRLWKELQPLYPDEKAGANKTVESRGTEAITNALVLVRYDSPDARMALDNMWAEQIKTGEAKGAWNWLQFHNKPWEGDSQYWGTTLAALAIGSANDRSHPEGVALLRDYLQRELPNQVLVDRVIALWASAKLPGLLTKDQQHTIIEEALSKQQDDGGFSLSTMVGSWQRRDKTPLEKRSDGYATGVVAYVLQEAGVKPTDPHMKRALDWLLANQDKTEGRWLAWSLNKQRDLSTDIGKFMSDAATAYAVMALARAR